MNYRLKGHESFILREGWLTKALFALSKDGGEFLFQQNSGADVLGVGTNMAKSIRYWLKTAGLTIESPKYGVKLSKLGRIVFDNDPYLEDLSTLFIIHCNIVCNYEMATSWYVFFNDFTLSSFSRNEMVEVLTNLLLEKTGERKLPERSIKDDVAAILSMYGNVIEGKYDPEDKKISPFAQLGLIEQNRTIYEKRFSAKVEVDPLLLLYIMAEKLNDNNSIHIDDIVNEKEMPGKLLNINRIMVNECLDKLEELGYITVNRTAGLDMVYLNSNQIDKEEIVIAHYGK